MRWACSRNLKRLFAIELSSFDDSISMHAQSIQLSLVWCTLFPIQHSFGKLEPGQTLLKLQAATLPSNLWVSNICNTWNIWYVEIFLKVFFNSRLGWSQKVENFTSSKVPDGAPPASSVNQVAEMLERIKVKSFSWLYWVWYFNSKEGWFYCKMVIRRRQK